MENRSEGDEFLRRHLGDRSFVCTCSIADNGLSLTTTDALVDTGAHGYLFISRRFADVVEKRLQVETQQDFTLAPVGGFDGKNCQKIYRAIRVDLKMQGFTNHGEWMLVIDSKHDILIGEMWLAKWDVYTDSRRKRLLFPTDRVPDPLTSATILLDPNHASWNVAHQQDADRCDRLLAEENRHLRECRQ